MSERFRKLFDAVVETTRKPVFQEAVSLAAVVAAALILAGTVYGLFGGVTIGVAFLGDVVRVFYPDQRVQTVAELLVTATFYVLGFVGLMLYSSALTRRLTPRASRYMLVFSSLLIAASALGLIGGYLSKF